MSQESKTIRLDEALTPEDLEELIERLRGIAAALRDEDPARVAKLGLLAGRDPHSGLPFVSFKMRPCWRFIIKRVCDLKIVDRWGFSGNTFVVVGCDLEGADPVMRANRYCLCNTTRSRMRVTFYCGDLGGPYELDPGDAVIVHVGNAGAGTGHLRCKYIIERFSDGSWKQCSGGGGGTDLGIDDP